MKQLWTSVKHPGFTDLSMENLAQMASRERWLAIWITTQAKVLADGTMQEESQAEKEQWIRKLKTATKDRIVGDIGFVPDDAVHSDGEHMPEGTILPGWSRIIVWRYLTEEEVEEIVEENFELLLTAITMYRSLANRLMRRLALQFDVDVARFSANNFLFPNRSSGELGGRQTGMLHDDGNGNEWHYYFHGHDCAFSNIEINTKVEARLGHAAKCGDDFGVIDHFFFDMFVCGCTQKFPKFMPLAQLFHYSKVHDGTNTQVALAYMEKRGVLRRLSENLGRGWDWVVVDGATRENAHL